MNKAWKDASRHANLEQVRQLLMEGMDIDSKDEHGQTALMNAAHAGHIELVRLLIEAGADLNVTAKYHLSALLLSLIAHHVEIARLLIEAGADISIRSTGNFGGQTAFSLAEQDGNAEILDLLRGKGAIS